MGNLVVTEFISLDGVIDSPGGGSDFEHAGWSFKFRSGEEGNKFKFDELMAADAQLLGRVTYEGFAKAWPSMTDSGEFGERMNSMPKYVVSTTLTDDEANWTNTTVIRANVAAEVARVKELVARDILIAGSAQLVRTLAERDLVDEYRLMVHPVVLGSGKRLFAGGMPYTPLRLASTTPLGPDGIIVLTYQPVR